MVSLDPKKLYPPCQVFDLNCTTMYTTPATALERTQSGAICHPLWRKGISINKKGV